MTGIATLQINNMPSHTLTHPHVVVRVVDSSFSHHRSTYFEYEFEDDKEEV